MKEGESLEERYPSIGKERFFYTEDMYCYNAKSNKEPVFNKNLKARLYDKEGNLLSEDFLRWDGPLSPELQGVISYIPYHNEGHNILIVSLKEKKEVILEDLYFQSQKSLRNNSVIYTSSSYNGSWWIFDEASECHLSPPLI